MEPGASERATASNPKDLPREQAAVAYWLSKKYRVAPEPLAVLVAEAYDIGARTKLDPTLILAVMAVESSFNPFAQSPVGAQGLMQVMTRVHTDKYEDFGGRFAAFDPVANLRVGVRVLQECIARAGSLEGGLRYYVGAANLPEDGGYAAKVLAEHFRLRQVAGGRARRRPGPGDAAHAVDQGRARRRRARGAAGRAEGGPAGRRLTCRPSATLAGYATGDRRGAPPGPPLTWKSGKDLFANHWGAYRAPRDPSFAWAALEDSQGTHPFI